MTVDETEDDFPEDVYLPCKLCGDDDTQGHHEDYSKVLDVVWLCRLHHEERHRELRLIERAIQKDVEK